MKSSEKLTIGVLLFYIIIILAIGIGWTKNIIKLTRCDFESPYKAEVMHSIGIIPPVGAVMGWLNFEDGKNK